MQSEPDVNPRIRIRYEDEAVVVLEKPAPLPVHPGGRFNRNTLQCLLDQLYAPQRPRPAHRLDANTTGLMVVARTKYFAGIVQAEFSRGQVEKVYLARVQGRPTEDLFMCDLPIGEEPLQAGSRGVSLGGLSAKTEFRIVERSENGTTLLEARPLTGRTNQIRVHLWQLGFPICGEQLYLPEKKLGKVQTQKITDPQLCLHASRLTFTHPLTKARLDFTSDATF